MKTSHGMSWAVKVVGYRLHQALGNAGMAGTAMLIAAVITGVGGWLEHQRFTRHRDEAARSHVVKAGAAREPVVDAKAVPRLSVDGPELLARIQKIANDQGIGWAKADYQINAATRLLPASLEVRCTYKASYPAVRRFIAMLMREEPALTLRDLSISRASADVADVDAKLSLLIFTAPSGPDRTEVKP